MSFVRNALQRGKLRAWAELKNELRKSHPLGYLFWECTLNCNFYCKHCGSSAGRKTFKDELSTSEIKAAFLDISQHFDAETITIAVTGGEPLMRPDLIEVMTYASELGFPWGMVSNGSLMTRDTVKKLHRAGMKTVVISIDDIGEHHDKFRNFPGAYKKAISAVRLLAEENFLHDLQITTTVTPDNIPLLDQMYEEFSPLGISSWRLIEVDPIGRAEENPKLFLNKKQMVALLDYIANKRKNSKISVSFGCSGFLGEQYEGKVRDWFFRCAAGVTSASILQNGDIFVCPNVPRDQAPIEGNVKNDSFSEVWQKKFKYYRDKNRTSCEKCNGCSFWHECQGGSLHHFDFDNKKPKVCYYQMIKK